MEEEGSGMPEMLALEIIVAELEAEFLEIRKIIERMEKILEEAENGED